MIITMSGKNGSGKGTVSKLLAEKLGYEYISIGNMKRELATAMGMTISEFNKEWEKPENKEKFDLKYEYYQKGLNVNSKIIRSRIYINRVRNRLPILPTASIRNRYIS